MSEEMTFRQATRTGVKPLIGLYGESGCGKTMSALLLARGLAGPSGKIGIVDTESGRASLYADKIEGGYTSLQLAPPFSPARYLQCFDAAEAQGVEILVIDSMSHEWEGAGGVLDWAGDLEEAGKKGQQVWKAPKMAHAMMVLRMCQSKMPVIFCIRAKYKTRQVKVNGKTDVVKDDYTSPIQAEDFIFEMTAHAEILRDHSIILTKCSHPDLRSCFPADRTDPISVKTGELIAEWASGGKDSSKPAVAPKSSPAVAILKRKLFELTKEFHKKDVDAFWSYLLDAGIIGSAEHESRNLTEERLIECIEAVEEKQP